MSDDLLKRADELANGYPATHWDDCWKQHDDCLAVRLAARVRELEAERSAMIDNVRFARERAERAEAERDALRVENEAHRQEANALANYVGALRDALTVIADRECADEDECAGVAMRCLRQMDAALAGGKT